MLFTHWLKKWYLRTYGTDWQPRLPKLLDVLIDSLIIGGWKKRQIWGDGVVPLQWKLIVLCFESEVQFLRELFNTCFLNLCDCLAKLIGYWDSSKYWCFELALHHLQSDLTFAGNFKWCQIERDFLKLTIAQQISVLGFSSFSFFLFLLSLNYTLVWGPAACGGQTHCALASTKISSPFLLSV